MPNIPSITSCRRQHITQLNEQRSVKGKTADRASGLTGSVSFVTGQNNACVSFHRMPGQNHVAAQLYREIARENLPADFNNAPLSEGGENIKNLLGIISSEVKKEDKALFNSVCKRLAEAKGKEKNERKVAKDVSTLMAKYGDVSLNKVISSYIEHCREAWRLHHQGHDAATPDEKIFCRDILACHEVLEKQIDILTKPNQSWVMMRMYSGYFEHGCIALSKTLRNYDASADNPPGKPINEQHPPAEKHPDPAGDLNKPQIVKVGERGNGDITIHVEGPTAYGGQVTNTVAAPVEGKHQAVATLGSKILDSTLKNESKEKLLTLLIKTSEERVKNQGKDPFIQYVDKVSARPDTPSTDQTDGGAPLNPRSRITPSTGNSRTVTGSAPQPESVQVSVPLPESTPVSTPTLKSALVSTPLPKPVSTSLLKSTPVSTLLPEPVSTPLLKSVSTPQLNAIPVPPTLTKTEWSVADHAEPDETPLLQQPTEKPGESMTGLGQLRRSSSTSATPTGLFKPAPGAFIDKTADVDRIVTTQPIHNHMNKNAVTQQQFSRPAPKETPDRSSRAAPAFSDPVGEKHSSLKGIHTSVNHIEAEGRRRADEPSLTPPATPASGQKVPQSRDNDKQIESQKNPDRQAVKLTPRLNAMPKPPTLPKFDWSFFDDEEPDETPPFQQPTEKPGERMAGQPQRPTWSAVPLTVPFSPAPGAFTGKAANVERIVTTQPIHSHMNKNVVTPLQFSRPAPKATPDRPSRAAPAFSDPVGEKNPSVRGDHTSVNHVEAEGGMRADEPSLVPQNTVTPDQKAPQPRGNDEQIGSPKKPDWRAANFNHNTSGNADNLTGYQKVYTTWRTVNTMNRDPGIRARLIPDGEGKDNGWIRQGKPGLNEEAITPQGAADGVKS